MARLFLATWPPKDVVDRLGRIPRADEPGVRWVETGKLHVTLRFLGDVDPGEALAALEGLQPPAATATLGPRIRRLGRNALVIPVGGLDAVACAVHDATAGIGRQTDHGGFHGHLTLARLRPRARSRLDRQAYDDHFAVDEVTLVRSDLGARGATYSTIAAWPTSDTETS